MAIAEIARASPRRRHGRRTLMCSSQPRFTPSRSFSSGQIHVWTTPATWSPSQATTHRLVSSSSRAWVVRKSSSVHSRCAPVVLERLGLRLEDRPVLVGRHRPDLEAVGERQVRHRREVRPSHQEEVADRDEPAALQERPVRRPHPRRRTPGTPSRVPGRLERRALGGTAQVLRRAGPSRCHDRGPRDPRCPGARRRAGPPAGRARPGSSATARPSSSTMTMSCGAGRCRRSPAISTSRLPAVGMNGDVVAGDWPARIDVGHALVVAGIAEPPGRAGRRSRACPAGRARSVSVIVVMVRPPRRPRRAGSAWSSRSRSCGPRTRATRRGGRPGSG